MELPEQRRPYTMSRCSVYMMLSLFLLCCFTATATSLVTHTSGAQCYYLRGRPRAILLFLQRLLLFAFTFASSTSMAFTYTAFAFTDCYFFLLICYFFEAPTWIAPLSGGNVFAGSHFTGLYAYASCFALLAPKRRERQRMW